MKLGQVDRPLRIGGVIAGYGLPKHRLVAGVGVYHALKDVQIVSGAAGDLADALSGAPAVEIVHPVVLAAHIVVGAGQQQKLCIRPVKPFLHGAETALKDGAFNMAKAVHCADKEHAVVQFGQRLDQKGIKLPAGQPVKFALELSPVSGLQHFQHRMFRHVIRLLGSESEYCFILRRAL